MEAPMRPAEFDANVLLTRARADEARRIRCESFCPWRAHDDRADRRSSTAHRMETPMIGRLQGFRRDPRDLRSGA
jgi:hypothetical protein